MQPATTKREVLAATMLAFDPLGSLTPSTIVMKIFTQELWEKGREWNGKMSDEEIKCWKEVIDRLECITDIHIPRFVGNGPAQLFCFCNASNKAYATAIYLRNITDGTVNLLFSKAQNAPRKKTLTIPRLELLSVLIGVRSLLFVTKALKIEVTERILWTVSKCVLQWIKGGGNQSVFVRNRIKEITEKQDIYLRYIDTK